MLRLPTFTAHFPRTIDDAVGLKAQSPGSAYVAGGTDLYPNMKRRQQTPAVVIDVRGIPELGRLDVGPDGTLRIVAGVTLPRLIRDPVVRDGWSALAGAAATISTPLLQNMGTVGGNLLLDTRCNYYNQTFEWRQAIDFCMKKDGAICWVAPSSPRCWAVQSSDLVPLMVALGAQVTLTGPRGTRALPAGALYRDDGMEFLTKEPDELLVRVDVPPLAGARAIYEKLRRRGSFDFPVLGVAAWMRLDGTGVVQEARIVLGAVGSYPKVCPEAATALQGRRLDDNALDAAAHLAARIGKPLDNTDFTISWRKDLIPVFVRRALAGLR